ADDLQPPGFRGQARLDEVVALERVRLGVAPAHVLEIVLLVQELPSGGWRGHGCVLARGDGRVARPRGYRHRLLYGAEGGALTGQPARGMARGKADGGPGWPAVPRPRPCD